MLEAVAWGIEDRPNGPSVRARLQERTELLSQGQVACTVVALLFATPDSPLIRTAEVRRDYFDARTGNLWDLYFPGYYRWGHMKGGRPLSREPDGPQFTPVAFNEMRGFVQDQGSWRYSGDADLVLVNCYLVGGGEPLVDWASLQGGPLVDSNGRYRQLSLGGVIERLTEGIEEGFEAADWNVGGTLWSDAKAKTHFLDSRAAVFGREVLAQVIASVLPGGLGPGLDPPPRNA
jgi:hypothetical protein